MNKEQFLLFKKQAHHLKPVVIIGNNALTSPVHQEIEQALLAHELIKIRINASSKEQRQAMTDKICQHHQAELINCIGHVVVIYRQNDDDSNPLS